MYEGKHCPSPREMQFLCVLMWFAHFTVFPLEKKKKKKGWLVVQAVMKP